MIKTNIKATTYKNIPTDLNEDMSYLDFKLGEKHFSENELKWFVKFHNMKIPFKNQRCIKKNEVICYNNILLH